MMTITIKDGKLSKTNFNSTQDLFIYLRKELTPLKLYLIDEDYLSEESLKKIEMSRNNPNKKLTDFQG
ncbi:MAG: hypothetical protein K8R54_12230 [Bacteroidales bacterium]|nr:hypothetical protein [Bacteroidales bacterium]